MDLNLSLTSLPEGKGAEGGGEGAGGRAPMTLTTETVANLEAQLSLLQSEVNFQTYLKQLHLAHLGTLHREKVLESGAEAERQSLVSLSSSFLTLRLD